MTNRWTMLQYVPLRGQPNPHILKYFKSPPIVNEYIRHFEKLNFYLDGNESGFILSELARWKRIFGTIHKQISIYYFS